jgi:hypothetical protein
MQRLAFFLLIAAFCLPAARAQDHVQFGAFADYMRLSNTKTNFGGLGGRLGITAFHNVKLEGEMSYDFDQAFTEGFTNTSNGSVTLQRSGLRLLHGEFGPKIDVGHGPLHPFVFLKGGFMNFSLSDRPATFATFASSVQGLRENNVSGVFYPGGGLEGHLGPLGLRLDVGDEMYFNNGSHNNLRVSFGPYIRF